MCKGCIYNENHAHGVRNLVTNLDFISQRQSLNKSKKLIGQVMKYVFWVIVILLVVFFFIRNSNNKKAAVENIIETASGLQYQVLAQGSGTEQPNASSRVKVHYHGSLLDGTVFDSSVDRGKPISFGLNQVISGWTEGVQLMVVGDKFKFYIPSNLGYGNEAAGKIAPGSLLIFEVELLEIQ